MRAGIIRLRSAFSRRYLQFSLRNCVILFVLLGAWLAIRANAANEQRKAIASIRQFGGYVSYDRQRGGSGVSSGPADSHALCPDWVRRWLGREFVDTPIGVSLSGAVIGPDGPDRASIYDRDLDCLQGLPYLEELSVEFQPISDKGICKTVRLKRLRRLNLYGTEVTDDALACIRTLHCLEVINVGESDVTVRGLTALLGMPALKEVVVSPEQLRAGGGRESVERILPGVEIVECRQYRNGAVMFDVTIDD